MNPNQEPQIKNQEKFISPETTNSEGRSNFSLTKLAKAVLSALHSCFIAFPRQVLKWIIILLAVISLVAAALGAYLLVLPNKAPEERLTQEERSIQPEPEITSSLVPENDISTEAISNQEPQPINLPANVEAKIAGLTLHPNLPPELKATFEQILNRIQNEELKREIITLPLRSEQERLIESTNQETGNKVQFTFCKVASCSLNTKGEYCFRHSCLNCDGLVVAYENQLAEYCAQCLAISS